MKLNHIGRLTCALVGATTMLAACQATMRVEFSPDAQFVAKFRVDPGEETQALLQAEGGDPCELVFRDSVDPALVDKIENVGSAEKPVCEVTAKPRPLSEVSEPGSTPGFKASLADDIYTVTWEGGGIGILEQMGPEGEANPTLGTLTMEYVFPGPVQEASGGQIDGNMVRYPDLAPFAQPGKIVASAKESGLLGGKVPWWLLVLGGLAVVAVIAALALRRRPYGQQPPTAPGGYPPATGPTGQPPQGYGPGGNAPQGYGPGTPPPAGSPPGYGKPPAGPYGPDQPPTAPPSQP
ncbi:hypothetical protein [Buchananella hordeovulneris]|uniref:hypothetical protein n=1 Tax=Buchananella hordeovulneris TaxID=52770 RepID=UPI000F5D6161|nr:hypothetical protein [Buchananella hordeovulneris]RRD42493.1 hypothetical protein EII13_09435 [Buchananella hordeovulneris]